MRSKRQLIPSCTKRKSFLKSRFPISPRKVAIIKCRKRRKFSPSVRLNNSRKSKRPKKNSTKVKAGLGFIGASESLDLLIAQEDDLDGPDHMKRILV